jgi:LmbE family N-acetylglucosaminyl deacetylase
MKRRLLALVAVALAGLIICAWAPSEEPRGLPALELALNRLPITGSVLQIGAHPDDEDTGLLAWLARGRGLRAAYLSVTRGEGGQNLLGTEQYEALGLVRTEELLAARRLDGGQQFFTRAIDFGYSKDPQEALDKWGHERTLSDVVRVIRRFRPEVIITRFSGRGGGHGHHDASGILAREAFRAAGDPARFPEHLKDGFQPWQAKKFYLAQGRGAGGPAPAGVLQEEMGGYSVALGMSYPEIAGDSRSLHRSQAMGVPQRRGPSRGAFLLQDTTLPAGLEHQRQADRDLMDGTDSQVGPGPLLSQIDAAQRALARLAGPPYRPDELIAALARGLELARQLPEPLRAVKEQDFITALKLAHGLAVDALAEQNELVPGEPARVTVSVWNRAEVPLEIRDIALEAPETWQQTGDTWTGRSLGYNESAARAFTTLPPPDTPPSQPYWLRLPHQGDAYEVADTRLIGLPENPPLMRARLALRTAGVDFELAVAVVNRHVDPLYGQRDRPVVVVPALAAWTDPALCMFPPNAEREVVVRLKNNARRALSAQWEIRSGAPAAPRSPRIAGKESGTIAVPAQQEVTGKQMVRAGAAGRFALLPESGERTGAGAPLFGYQVISYPHIRPQYLFRSAETRLVPLDVQVAPNLRLGYIMGAGDEVPEALRQLGAAVQLLAAEDLTAGDLARFDAIVAGIRAYAVRKDLAEANARLLEYVKQGGVFIVQYNSDWPGRGGPGPGPPGGGGGQFPFGPYPMRLNRGARVAEEDAPVEILAPQHPLLTTPNKITEADFKGWVQERGLYFMSEWAQEYTPLLASHDRGEPALQGGMLVARFGKGLYVYTGYAWFRQLPAGVPGAFRIWANLLSCGKK